MMMAHISTKTWTLTVLVIGLVHLTGNHVSAIKCYHCTIQPPMMYSNETKRLCVDFDYTEKYVVDCPYSTMCMKKAFQLPLQNGEMINAVLRDCAAQKRDNQVYRNNKWQKETDIEEAYEEGCKMEDNKGIRTIETEYCYCRRNLCNSASSNDRGELNYHTDAMAVIFVFNAIRYFRSME